MRIFWPRNCHDGIEKCPTGYLYIGWNNKSDEIVVVTALPYFEPDMVATLLERDGLLANEYTSKKPSLFMKFIHICFQNTHENIESPSNTRTASQLYARLKNKRLSIVGTSRTLPRTGLFCVNESNFYKTAYDNIGSPCLMIAFDPPDPTKMHYFTLEKANLFDSDVLKSIKPLLHKELEFHTAHATPKLDKWDIIIPQLNCVHDLQHMLRQNAARIFPELRRMPSSIQKFINLSEKSHENIRNASLRPRSRSFVQPRLRLVQLIMTVRSMVEVGLKSLETVYGLNFSATSIFCTAQQIDLRLNQLCYLPHEYIAITRRSQQDWHWLTPDRNEAYIRFNNYLLLGVYDLILGTYLCTLLSVYTDKISLVIHQVMDALCLKFIELTHWLMTWPAGLKLNTQLAHFIGEITIWVISAWYAALASVLTPNVTKKLIKGVAFSGMVGGATLQISLVIDMFALLSFHLYLLYQLLARVYAQQCSILLSLSRLFRGKKYNVLRNRVDHGDYDVHQLLLGTILFAVVLFLFPTVLVFYSVFTIARLAVLSIICILCMGLAFLNYFPLLPLLLWIKSPRRVPSGITFEIISNTGSSPYLFMKTKSMELSKIFSQYLITTSTFVKDSFNVRMVKELCTGEVINIQQSRLYASLYTMLPSRRRTPKELYLELQEYLGIK